MKWYAVQVATAHEKKVKNYLEKRKSNDLADVIGEVVIPEKDGAPIIPGYIFLQSITWPELYLINYRKCNVIGTVTEDELNKLLNHCHGNDLPRPSFRQGDEVIICSGPLRGTKGVIKRPGVKRSKISFFDGEVIIDAENKQLIPAKKGA